jgi:hypothetical protein
MPEGLVIIWQLGASSGSPGGSIKVFIDARGGLCDYVAVRCQLLFVRQAQLRGRNSVFAKGQGSWCLCSEYFTNGFEI